LIDRSSLENQAFESLKHGQYDDAVTAFDRLVVERPTETRYYAYLGLAYLLRGEEAEAQLAWMTPILEGDAEAWSLQLSAIVRQSAEEQTDPERTWLLRQHLREIDPNDLENLLQVLQLSLELQRFSEDDDLLEQIAERLQALSSSEIPQETLWETIDRLLPQTPNLPGSLEFFKVAAMAVSDLVPWVDRLLDRAKTLELANRSEAALELGQVCVELSGDRFRPLVETARFLQNNWDNAESIDYLDRALAVAETLPEKILASHLKLRGLMRAGGQWERAEAMYAQHRGYLEALLTQTDDISLEFASRIITAGSMTAYFTDDLPGYRQLRNQIASVCQHHLQEKLVDLVHRYQTHTPSTRRDVLKIGYLSECFRKHSVGWLVRWLFQHHDRNRFEIHLYSLHHTGDELQQTFAAAEAPNFHELPYSARNVADKIHQDSIDILVDLDSITSNCGCSALALKCAPVQVSWLGCDASGLPAVDYFIADPYVLPENAQQYYGETLWRLPQTYIAVDGFEIGVPTLRRDRLGIPKDAVVYFSSQTGYKRNPDDARMQLQILRGVPNSYFLIKGLYTDAESVRRAFEELAEAEGVARDRLRFLPVAESEMVHRANIAIADVVLDTYPYNGTTTTLETLWVGVPVVTRVGQQFASRQGYTLLKNVGVEEGIAFTAEEYVEWGIRLGKDAELRRQVTRKLQLARRSAPLWNARQFTREMEQAFEEMITFKSRSLVRDNG